MRLLVVAVGRLRDGPERELVARYADRIGAAGRGLGFTGPDVLEVAESRAARAADRKVEEGVALRAKAGDAAAIPLDETGQAGDSGAFARSLARRRDAGRRSAAFVIGGADGIDPALAARPTQSSPSAR